MNKMMNLQDVFLNQARKEKILVTIILMNGFQFKGIVKGFDSYIVILECNGEQNLVYKHATNSPRCDSRCGRKRRLIEVWILTQE